MNIRPIGYLNQNILCGPASGPMGQLWFCGWLDFEFTDERRLEKARICHEINPLFQHNVPRLCKYGDFNRL